MERGAAGLVSVALLLTTSCGPAPAGEMAALSFPSTPFQTLVSAAGRVHVAVRWSPAVPVKGENAAQVTFSDDLGNPIDGLSVAVLPWMPAHGHGTSVQPAVVATAPGVLVATPVYLYMSGAWQLRMTITGALDDSADSAVATVQIP